MAVALAAALAAFVGLASPASADGDGRLRQIDLAANNITEVALIDDLASSAVVCDCARANWLSAFKGMGRGVCDGPELSHDQRLYDDDQGATPCKDDD
ncbi:hypothetical protein ADK52_14320 [Streptomyces sp. WM6372]|nr:hypothetical protein ADK52_14320 [Streptomyces sp. WM6372]